MLTLHRLRLMPLLFIICRLFFSCSSHPSKVSTFRIEEAILETTELRSSLSDSTEYRHLLSFLKDAHVKFGSDDTVSILAPNGNFSFGKYTSSGKQILDFSLNGIGAFALGVKQGLDQDGKLSHLMLTGLVNGKYKVKMMLQKDDYYNSYKYDLLSLKANRWRIKPESHESKENIRKRMMEQLAYMITYFSHIEDEKFTSFRVSHLRAPFRFYSNGIGIDDFSTSEYSKIFYDNKDAGEAILLLSQGLKSISGAYPSDPKRFTKGYLNALNKIRDYLKFTDLNE